MTKTEINGRKVCMTVTVLIVASLTTRITVYGRLNVNVALNRPTFMSSTYSEPLYGGAFSASRAVDGNTDTGSLYIGNSCVHTLVETNPWWAVDLGVPLKVTGVLFTNRADLCGFRSDNFIIGLTDVSPDITAPTLWNYDVCGQYPGVVGEGATVCLKCKCKLPRRRYLIVQIAATEVLNFCEIKVFIRRFEWSPHIGQKMINKVAANFQVESRVYCHTNCTFSPICDSYNYRASDKTCQLNTHDDPLFANSADIVADSEWLWFMSKFTSVV